MPSRFSTSYLIISLLYGVGFVGCCWSSVVVVLDYCLLPVVAQFPLLVGSVHGQTKYLFVCTSTVQSLSEGSQKPQTRNQNNDDDNKK
jgi:hypothetical protein